MQKIGFDTKKEILPSFDKFQNKVNQRKMFLKLFNEKLPCALKFKKDDLNLCNQKELLSIYIEKIFCLFKYDFDTKKSKNEFFVDIEKTNKINKFLLKVQNQTNKKITSCDLLTFKKDLQVDFALTLIDFLNEEDFSLYLDTNECFNKFVSNRIIKKNENKKINIKEDSIEILNDKNAFMTKIYTFFEFINSQDLKIDRHIQKAIDCVKQGDFKQVYLVYPKNENFMKHISVKADSQIGNNEYQIKLIPYSLRSILR